MSINMKDGIYYTRYASQLTQLTESPSKVLMTRELTTALP